MEFGILWSAGYVLVINGDHLYGVAWWNSSLFQLARWVGGAKRISNMRFAFAGVKVELFFFFWPKKKENHEVFSALWTSVIDINIGSANYKQTTGQTR